ncbi:MAG: hypothetical protein J6R60_01610 [Clostridia bacterium]|nr:hypothetical protein [Clostridia bacterium]
MTVSSIKEHLRKKKGEEKKKNDGRISLKNEHLEVVIFNFTRLNDHPQIEDAVYLDTSQSSLELKCPVCCEECERIYYKLSGKAQILGCDMCIGVMSLEEYVDLTKR